MVIYFSGLTHFLLWWYSHPLPHSHHSVALTSPLLTVSPIKDCSLFSCHLFSCISMSPSVLSCLCCLSILSQLSSYDPLCLWLLWQIFLFFFFKSYPLLLLFFLPLWLSCLPLRQPGWDSVISHSSTSLPFLTLPPPLSLAWCLWFLPLPLPDSKYNFLCITFFFTAPNFF